MDAHIDPQLQSDLALCSTGPEIEIVLQSWMRREARRECQRLIDSCLNTLQVLRELDQDEQATREEFIEELAEIGRRVERDRQGESGENDPIPGKEN